MLDPAMSRLAIANEFNTNGMPTVRGRVSSSARLGNLLTRRIEEEMRENRDSHQRRIDAMPSPSLRSRQDDSRHAAG